MIYIIQSWIEGKRLQLTPKKIIITIFILIVFTLISTYIQNPQPDLPRGIDNVSIDTIKSLWNNEGVSLYRQQNYTGAILCFDKAIGMDPEYTLAWTNKGDALKELERFPESESCYEKARKILGE